jgi:hypothetical protein
MGNAAGREDQRAVGELGIRGRGARLVGRPGVLSSFGMSVRCRPRVWRVAGPKGTAMAVLTFKGPWV